MRITQMGRIGRIGRMSKLPVLFLSMSIVAATPAFAEPDATAEPRAERKAQKKVLVVTYSQTGNTKAVAQQIIERFDADAVFIKAPEYEDETRSASSDAWDEVRTAIIEPEALDMSQYDLVFLGSPIWWYRPAVPLWAFVEKNSFRGKKVVLFNTFKSRFKDEYIAEFKGLVEERGGEWVDHIYVRRGRIIWQLSREELLAEFNAVLDKKKEAFEGHVLREE